jgi:hypothetical protein
MKKECGRFCRDLDLYNVQEERFSLLVTERVHHGTYSLELNEQVDATVDDFYSPKVWARIP